MRTPSVPQDVPAECSDVAMIIRQHEARRCAALVGADLATLRRLLHPELTHVHASGVIEDRQTYLASVGSRIRFLEVERETLDVDAFGATALAVGWLRQTLFVPRKNAKVAMRTFTTLVWVATEEEWRLRAFQATREPTA